MLCDDQRCKCGMQVQYKGPLRSIFPHLEMEQAVDIKLLLSIQSFSCIEFTVISFRSEHKILMRQPAFSFVWTFGDFSTAQRSHHCSLV